MNPTATDDIIRYVEAVRAALAGLPETTRIELLEDLPEHLAEVLSEGQGSLVERLGPPERYAAELLTSAGYVGGGFPTPPPPGAGRRVREVRDALAADVARVLGRADRRIGPLLGYPRAGDFLTLLRPAWWVLRGYLVAMAISVFVGDVPRYGGLVPRIGGSALIGLLLLAACVAASVQYGRRALTLRAGPRLLVGAATAALLFFGLVGLVELDGRTTRADYDGVSSYDPNPYSNVRDVYVYDSQGRLVEGARLFDQDGAPIQLGETYCVDPETGEGGVRNLGYPYCPGRAPFASPSAVPTTAAPTPTPTTPAATPATPAIPATPTRQASPSPSGR